MVHPEKITMLPNGVKVLNTTPHPITFKTPAEVIVTIPPCGFVLNANIIETPVKGPIEGVDFVTASFVPNKAGSNFIDEVPNDVLIVGSLMASQAYPERVVSLVPHDGKHRRSELKRMSIDKFTIFR